MGDPDPGPVREPSGDSDNRGDSGPGVGRGMAPVTRRYVFLRVTADPSLPRGPHDTSTPTSSRGRGKRRDRPSGHPLYPRRCPVVSGPTLSRPPPRPPAPPTSASVPTQTPTAGTTSHGPRDRRSSRRLPGTHAPTCTAPTSYPKEKGTALNPRSLEIRGT